MNELQLAVRRLRKQPAATLASILTLGFAIAAASTTWTVFDAVILRPLPVVDPDRLVAVQQRVESGRGRSRLVDQHLYSDYVRIRESGIFDGVATHGTRQLPVEWRGAFSELTVAFVSHDYFDVLGVKPAVGREFVPEDDRPDAPGIAVLSHRYWTRTVGADGAVLGSDITIAGQRVTIVGVAPRGFRGTDLASAPSIYLTLHSASRVNASANFFAHTNHPSSPVSWLALAARLRGDSAHMEAAARIDALQATGGKEVSRRSVVTALSTTAVPAVARTGMRQFTTLLAATVGLLLMVGCGTVGMLLLVRTDTRREEFAMCLALGAPRGRLVQGVALESALLALFGFILAQPLAQWLLSGLRVFQLPGGVDIDRLDLTIDSSSLAVAASCGMLAALLIAVVAATVGLSVNVSDVIRARGGATARATRRHTRTVLIASEVAVALVLVAGAGVFARSLARALNVNSGYEIDRLVTGTFALGRYGYAPPRSRAFIEELGARLRGNPAVRTVAWSSSLGAFAGAQLTVQNGPLELTSSVAFVAINEEYFRAMGMTLVSGRPFSSGDTDRSHPVGVVSESLARLIARDGNPIGRRVTLPYRKMDQPYPQVQIVGIVRDVVLDLQRREPLVLYMPMVQHEVISSASIILRASSGADAAKRELLSAVSHIDSTLHPTSLLTLEERLGRQMSAQRFGLFVLSWLGTIATLLTALGTFVLAESAAAIRMREMSLRRALGATRVQIAKLVLLDTGRLVGFGLAGGLLLTWLGSGTIRSLTSEVASLDYGILSATAILILGVSLAVSMRAAMRAANADLSPILHDH